VSGAVNGFGFTAGGFVVYREKEKGWLIAQPPRKTSTPR